MLKHARGVLCAPITVSRCKELDLPHQVTDNTSVLGTPFTVTVDKIRRLYNRCFCSRPCCNHSGTGRSAFHSGYFRSPRTYQSFVCAGERGITSCWAYRSYDWYVSFVGFSYPAGALMEIMNEDGTMARLPELRKMADEFNLKLISIRDMIAYRLQQVIYRRKRCRGGYADRAWTFPLDSFVRSPTDWSMWPCLRVLGLPMNRCWCVYILPVLRGIYSVPCVVIAASSCTRRWRW